MKAEKGKFRIIEIPEEDRQEIRAILDSPIAEQLKPDAALARSVGVVYTDPPGVCWPLQG